MSVAKELASMDPGAYATWASKATKGLDPVRVAAFGTLLTMLASVDAGSLDDAAAEARRIAEAASPEELADFERGDEEE